MLALGPASAMALVPTLDWWKISDPYSGLDRPIYVAAPREELWPQTITSKVLSNFTTGATVDLNDSCSTLQNPTKPCPAAGYNEIAAWAASNSTTGRPANITMVEPYSGIRRRLQSQAEDSSNQTLLSYFPGTPDPNNAPIIERLKLYIYLRLAGTTVLTTTASHWVLLLLGGFWDYANNANLGLINQSARPKFQIEKNIPIYEPLVSTRCSAWNYMGNRKSHIDLKAPFVRNAFGETGFTDYDTWGWTVPSSAWNFARPLTAVNFTWVDFRDLDERVNASIGGVFTVPFTAQPPNGTFMQASLVVPCTVEARWIASELVYDPRSLDIISDNVTDPIDFAYNHADYDPLAAAARFGASPIINITSDWANMLNVPTSNGVLPGSNRSMASILEGSIGRDKQNQSMFCYSFEDFELKETPTAARELSKDLAGVLGFVVADGLSRIQFGLRNVDVIYHRNSTSASSTSLINQAGSIAMLYNETHTSIPLSNLEANATFYSLDVQRWGYGYGLQTKASHFSIAMLMLYGCIALGYIVWFNIQQLIRPRSDWSLITNKWSSISEMLALAINSPPSTKLDGTCAGIEENRSWKQIIRIREVEDKHLALVVGEGRDEHPRVQRDVQYGSLPVQPELEENKP